jgi:hypothetical protein
MHPDASIVKSGLAFCLAGKGEIYGFYLPQGGAITIELPEGESYEIEWWDPGNGVDGQFQDKRKIKGGKVIIKAPGKGDWAARVKRSSD